MKNDDMDTIKIPDGHGLQFSAVKAENLGATEYTLVTIVCDLSGSVSSYRDDLLKCCKTIIEACKKSPRAENLLLRLVGFNTSLFEIHGFKLLSVINPNDYKDFNPTGGTALFDATYESIGAALTYSKSLIDQDFNVNGAIYIITDGDDNSSHIATPKKIKKQMDDSKKAENIESLITILIGVNTQDCKNYLQNFKDEAELTQFVDSGDATAQRLAKLAAFVSKSISSTSVALGTGSPSQPISATF